MNSMEDDHDNIQCNKIFINNQSGSGVYTLLARLAIQHQK